MSFNLNGTTPQSKVIENLFRAYLTLDISKIEPFISKDFKFQTLPKIAGLPEEAKGGHFDTYSPLFSLLKKVEVRIQHRLRARRLRSIIPSMIFMN